jgi:hypothetical protein
LTLEKQDDCVDYLNGTRYGPLKGFCKKGNEYLGITIAGNSNNSPLHYDTVQ